MSNKKHVLLQFACPPGCACQSTEKREWYHQCCQTRDFINEMGDIFCQKHKNGQGCNKYFIKDAKFQCHEAKKNETYYQYNNPADFLMAIAQGMKAAEFALSDQDSSEFAKNLTAHVVKRWYS